MGGRVANLRRAPRRGRGPGALTAAFTALAALIAHGLAGAVAAQDAPAAGRTGTAVITGIVVADPVGDPLAATAVHLWSAADSILVAQAETTSDGAFRIERIAAGEYYLRLVHLNGVVATAPFELVDAETRNLGTLQVPIEVVALAPIEVSAERVAVTFELDRTSYIVGLMPGAEGAAATDVLRSIPEMVVDIDGRIQRRGREPAIYINDRPAPMSREALALFLEQFPADHIQKIEVIDNPSARYRAEGAGGVINIVLKQGVDPGTSGSAFVNAGTRGQYGIGTRGTFQRGRWMVDGNGLLNLTSMERSGFDLRQNLIAEPAFLRQDSWSNNSGLSGNLHLNTRYDRSERLHFFAQGRINPSRNESNGLTTTTHMDGAETTILVYDRASDNAFRNVSADIRTGFEYQWDRREHRLKFDVRLNNGGRSSESREEITGDIDVDYDVPLPAELTRVDEDNGEAGALLNLEYTHPWGEGGRIELGFQSTLNESDNERVVRLLDDTLAAPARGRTDWRFDQRQRSSAFYATLGRQLGRLGVQAGLRAEHVDHRFTTATGEPFNKRYFDLFPSATISYSLGGTRQLHLSYSRRIARPDASVLDPTDRSTDPLNRIVGNPGITPQYSHQVMLNASRSGSLGSLGVASHYTRTTNEWMMITTVDDDGVSTRTNQNLASSTSYGGSLTYSMQRRGGWNGHLSLSGMRHVRDADNLAEHYSGGSFRWHAQAMVNARLIGHLAAQGMFSYSPPIDLPQGRQSGANYTADFGLRYRVLDNRASVRLSLQDPFGLRESSRQLQDSTYILIGRSRESTRSAQLSMSYTWAVPGGMRRGRGEARIQPGRH